MTSSTKEEIQMFKFALGDKVKDTVTGFTGIIYSRSEMHNSETVREYLLVATDATGCPCAMWFPEDRLVFFCED